jgi:hypothetical protein
LNDEKEEACAFKADNDALVGEIESFGARDTREDHKPAASSAFLVEESTVLQSNRFQALSVKIDSAYSYTEP